MKIQKYSGMAKNKQRDLSGLAFGKWTVLALAGSVQDSGGAMRKKWLCRCACGNEKLVNTGPLTTGKSTGCGCWRIRHGSTIRKQPSPEYVAWASMKQRCLNVNTSRYKDYGGRGITICESWLKSFEAFLSDMGVKPSPDHSLDRIDNHGNYEASNCRWATRSQQQLNKRPHSFDNLPQGSNHWTKKDPCRAATLARSNMANTRRDGENNGNAKLTKAMAQELKEFARNNKKMKMQHIGEKFGVGRETARKVVRGISW
jgi:hypothetical protein